MKNADAGFVQLRTAVLLFARASFLSVLTSQGAKQLFAHINKHFSTLAFCRRWLDRQGQDRHLGMSLSLSRFPFFHGRRPSSTRSGWISQCVPPACRRSRSFPLSSFLFRSLAGSYTAQFEHTLVLKPTGKEVLSRGDDY